MTAARARGLQQWFERVRRALLLDASVFEEVEHDASAGGGALLVVLAASVAGGVGNLGAARLLDGRPVEPSSMLILTAAFVVAWTTWSFVMMAVGTTLFRGVADMGEMQRSLGFAAAPGLLMILPGLGAVVGIPWALAAMILAVRQALDLNTSRALATVAVGAGVMALFLLPAACYLNQALG